MYQQIERSASARHLGRAERTYEGANFVQRQISDRLLARLELIKITPASILNLDLHPTDTEPQLQARYKKANIISLSNPDVLASQEDSSVDLVISNLFLHWFNNPDEIVQHCFRLLKPDGLFFFTLPGPDTLKELRQSFLSVGIETAVHEFIDMHDVGDVLLQNGFSDPVSDAETVELRYKSLSRLFLDLKETGAQNCRSDRAKHWIGKNRWNAMCESYDKLKVTGKFPVTAEITFAHAWVPQSKFKKSVPGEFSVSVDSIKKMTK